MCWRMATLVQPAVCACAGNPRRTKDWYPRIVDVIVRREKALDFSGCNSRTGTGSLHLVAIETARAFFQSMNRSGASANASAAFMKARSGPLLARLPSTSGEVSSTGWECSGPHCSLLYKSEEFCTCDDSAVRVKNCRYMPHITCGTVRGGRSLPASIVGGCKLASRYDTVDTRSVCSLFACLFLVYASRNYNDREDSTRE